MARLTEGKNFTSGETVTPAKLHELVNNATIANIVNADISNTAAISPSKLAAGVLPAGITIASANIIDGTIATADLADNAINNAKLRDSLPVSVIGNSTNATADPADIAAANDGEVLRRSGTALGFGKLSALAFPSNFPIQIVQAVKSDVQIIDTGTTDWVDVTNLSIPLTRAIASASGKVRIQASISCTSNNAGHGIAFRIMRGATAIGVGITEGNRLSATTMGSYDANHVIAPTFIDFIDAAPGSSASVTYKIQARIYSIVLGYINRSNSNTDAGDYSYRTISTMTLTELSP
jgi:hypothetical protein